MSRRKARWTKVSALAEARRRWGEKAVVEVRPAGRYSAPNKGDAPGPCTACFRDCTDKRKRHLLGVVKMGLFVDVKGTGHSWEEAFAAADTRD